MNEEKSNIALFEICRLCLEQRGYLIIFDETNLLDDIYKCTGLQISPSDDLPQKICEICLDIVVKATELRIIANNNDLRLRCVFNCLKEETNSEHTGASPEETKTALVKEENENPIISVRKDLFENPKKNIHNIKEELEAGDSLNKIRQLKPKHEIANTEYKCPVCSKIFTKWKKLYIHHRFHNKSYNCPIERCSKKFATKGDLEKHIRTHTGEKPYTCDECDRSFAQRGTLKAHKNSVHT